MFSSIISFLGKFFFYVCIYLVSATVLGLIFLFILYLAKGKGSDKHTYSKEDDEDQMRAIKEYYEKREEKLAKKQKK